MRDPFEQLDTASVRPEDLLALTDAEFRRVVDADLRRRAHPEGLSDDVAEALRSPGVLRRWHTTLTAILRSVDGQLAARATQVATGDGDVEDYLRWKLSVERFRSGLEVHLATAEGLLATGDTAVLLADARRRVRHLERAIDAHRLAVLKMLAGGPAEAFDVELWEALEDR